MEPATDTTASPGTRSISVAVGGSTTGEVPSGDVGAISQASMEREKEGPPSKFEEEAEPASLLQMLKYSSFKDRAFTAVRCAVAVVTGFSMPILIVLMGHLLRKFNIFQSVEAELCGNQSDPEKIHDGLAEKIGMCLFFLSTAVASIISAFWHGWQLALVVLALVPCLVIVTTTISKVQSRLEAEESLAYRDAGAVAMEAITFIRTVIAYGGQLRESKRYSDRLASAKRTGFRKGLVASAGVSVIWASISASYAFSFWYGIDLIVADFEHPPGHRKYLTSMLIIVFFSVLMFSMSLGQATPYFQAFANAKRAAGKVNQITDRTPAIDSSSSLGLKPAELEGAIEFNDVTFCYPPSTTNTPALQKCTMSIDPGETVAVIGKQKCGKSTIIHLLQRFYGVTQGQATATMHQIIL